MKLLRYKIITLILAFPFYVFGQFEYNFIRYTLKDGLPSNKIYDIIQDKEGFIWFGTDKGIAKFDGYQFQLFTTRNGLPNNDMWSLYSDKKGRIFAKSYYNGFTCIEKDEVKLVPFPFLGKWTNAIGYIELGDKVWLRGGIYICSFEDTLKQEFAIESSYDRYLNSLYNIDSVGNLY